jgi:hypothetical protein
MGFKPAAQQVLLCCPQPYLQIVYILQTLHYFGRLFTPVIVIFPRAAREQAHIKGCGPLSYEVWTNMPLRVSSLLRTHSKLENKVLNKGGLCSIETQLSCLCVSSPAISTIQLIATDFNLLCMV